MRFEPRNYQRHATNTIIAQKKCALHIGCGLGKTVAVLTALKKLRDDFAILGALVVAPLRVCTLTWPDEVRKWDHLRDLDLVVVRGTAEQRLRILHEYHDIYVINYEHMAWLCEWIRACREVLPFDTIVLDESSKVKSSASKRFKIMKPIVTSSLFKRVIEMTGTPMPEHYENLWSQYYLLDKGARLLPFVTHFRSRWMEQNPWNRFERKMRKGAHIEIEKRIADCTLALRSEDWLELKKVVVNDIKIELPAAARKVYDEIEREMVTKIRDEEVIAGNAAIVGEKCRQVAAGALYLGNAEDDGPRRVEQVHTAKIDALADIIEESDENLLVAFWYKWEADEFRKRWPKAPILGSGVSDAKARAIVGDWNKGKTRVLFMHPMSVGHGINLQGGGSTLIFTVLPWSGEAYDQTIHRLQRMGQTRPVVVHRLLIEDSVDEAVAKALHGKDFTQASLLKALSERSRKAVYKA
jgi:hypothetical protein